MKNCWTCKHNGPESECLLLVKAGGDPNALIDAVAYGVLANCNVANPMPDPNADGCPGYDPIFAPQASWSTDRMDGSGNATNPSGIAADPSATVHHVYIPWNDTLIKGKP